MDKSIRVAAVQMRSVPDRDVNLAAAGALVDGAVAMGAEIVSLPENFSFLGAADQKPDHAENPDDSPSLRFLRDSAIRHSIYLVGGTLPLRTDDPRRVTNSCFVVGPDGQVVARYDKMHLFDVSIDERNTYRESDYVVPGDAVATFEAGGLTFGLSICFDLRFPELYRRMTDGGTTVLFVPSAFTVPTGRAHWEVLLRARAIENLSYVVAPAQTGLHVEKRESYGHSMIIDPWGAIVAAAAEKPGVIWAEINTELIRQTRERLPALAKRRTDIFSP